MVKVGISRLPFAVKFFGQRAFAQKQKYMASDFRRIHISV